MIPLVKRTPSSLASMGPERDSSRLLMEPGRFFSYFFGRIASPRLKMGE
jgi:hypothetical protein